MAMPNEMPPAPTPQFSVEARELAAKKPDFPSLDVDAAIACRASRKNGINLGKILLTVNRLYGKNFSKSTLSQAVSRLLRPFGREEVEIMIKVLRKSVATVNLPPADVALGVIFPPATPSLQLATIADVSKMQTAQAVDDTMISSFMMAKQPVASFTPANLEKLRRKVTGNQDNRQNLVTGPEVVPPLHPLGQPSPGRKRAGPVINTARR